MKKIETTALHNYRYDVWMDEEHNDGKYTDNPFNEKIKTVKKMNKFAIINNETGEKIEMVNGISIGDVLAIMNKETKKVIKYHEYTWICKERPCKCMTKQMLGKLGCKAAQTKQNWKPIKK